MNISTFERLRLALWRRGAPTLALAGLLSLAAAGTAAAQTGTIAGAVVGQEDGRPLSAVQLHLVGTGLGTLSNVNGRYLIINVPVGTHTIVALRIGFGTQEIEITVGAGQTTVQNIQLTIEALGLDEIVVTGTAGASRRREIGNTIAQINLSEVNEPPLSVDALLQARVPGMTVMQSSAASGGGARIRLRGNVSVAMSNQPILYVDGIRVRSDAFHKNVPATGYPGRSGNDVASPLNDINPGDIERIEIIKGAAATTLYGTEAAAGVIQIFTKRGHRGQARWTASIEQGVAYTLPFGFTGELPPSEPAALASGATPAFLYIDPWLRNAWQQKYSLSVAGGGERFLYFVSGSFEDDEGVMPKDTQTKYVVRGNFTFNPFEELQLQWNTSYTNNDISNTAAGNNAHGLTLNAFRREANYLGSELFEDIDPFTDQEITTQIDHIITGMTATHSPTANFTHRLTVGYDLASQENRNLRPFGFVRAPRGIINDSRSEFTTLTFDYVATYRLGLTDAIRSSLSWGGQSITSKTEQTVAYGQDFPGPGEPVVTSAGTTLGFEFRERVINAGFFVQNVFDINNKYFITGGLRIDGNSAFGENLGLQAYPKVSASWVASDEDFWKPGWGTLKVRGALGQSGRAPGAFDAVRTFDPVGFGGAPAFFPRNVGNADLGPERTTEWEVGFDGAFADNRLVLEFTYYNQKTSDALFFVSQIPSNGFGGSQLENVGTLKNTGIELVASAMLLRGQNWSWELGGSVYTNSSEVGLPEEVPNFQVGSNGWILDGEAVPTMRGDCVTNADALAEPIYEEDCIYGPNQPTHIIGGFTTVGLPGGLTLSARGEFQGGHFIYDGAAWNAVRRSVSWAGCFDAYRINETTGRDGVTALDRARCLDVGGPNHVDELFIYPAEFFKLRELTLNVPIPDRWLPAGEGATLTVSGHNVWRWVNDDFPVFEPEMGNNNDNNEISRDGASSGDFLVTSIFEHVPPPATWTVALRWSF